MVAKVNAEAGSKAIRGSAPIPHVAQGIIRSL
jgi:hypothetical protein